AFPAGRRSPDLARHARRSAPREHRRPQEPAARLRRGQPCGATPTCAGRSEGHSGGSWPASRVVVGCSTHARRCCCGRLGFAWNVMRLINQVLKDLERGHAGQVVGAARAVRPLPESGSGRAVWIVFALSTVGAAAALLWYLMPSTSAPGTLGAVVDAPMHAASAAAPANSASLSASPNSAAASPVPVAPTQQSAAVEGAPLKASAPIDGAEGTHGLPQGPASGRVSREARTPGFPSGRLHSRRQDPVAYADGAAAAPRRDGVFAGVDRRQAPEEPASAEPSSAQRPDSNGA